MSRSNYLIKDYEQKVNGRVLCIEHGLLRCSECAYVDNLEKQNKRYREAFKQIKLQILFDGAIEDHRENIIEIIDETLEGEE